MEPRRIEFTEADGWVDCLFNYDSFQCNHPDGGSFEWACPGDAKMDDAPPPHCPLRQRPALVVLKTGGSA